MQGRDDGEVVRDFAVVENPLRRFDPALLQNLAGRHHVVVALLQHLQRFFDGGDVVLWQRARIGTRVGQHFVAVVQRLRHRQRVARRQAEAAIDFALQAGEVKQQGRRLGGRPGLFGDDAGLAAAGRDDAAGGLLMPDALGARVFAQIFVCVLARLFEPRVEPAAGILTGLDAEAGMHFPVVTRFERADFGLALDQHCQRRGLHPAHGGQVKAAFFAVESGHGTGAIDADQPVGFRAAARGIGQRQHVLVIAQMGKALGDRALRHRLQPQALDRLFAAGVLRDQTKNQFALAPGVAGVNQRVHILALDELGQEF